MTLKIKVGLFSLFGLLLLGVMTVVVNDRPYWWRSCELIHVNVDDATGLKSKSPVKSLGLQIGYLSTIELSETHVRLGVCITAPVEVLPSTRAFLRGEGFLGDKFLELKPVKFLGKQERKKTRWDLFVPEANAASAEVPGATPTPTPTGSYSPVVPAVGKHDIPVGEKSQDVQAVVDQVNGLVKEMTGLTSNLKEAINPQEFRQAMVQLNKALENATKTLAPEGSLNTTARRALLKLEDTIEQMRDLMTRINRGEGSVGKLLNDPVYADELHEVLKGVNKLLRRVNQLRVNIDVFAENLPAYHGARAGVFVSLWTSPERYYRLGVSVDPRGQRSIRTISTTAGGQTVHTTVASYDPTAYVINAMLGKIFWKRVDLSLGVLNGDGAVSIAGWLGGEGSEDSLILRSDVYSRGQGSPIDARFSLSWRPFYSVPGLGGIYLKGGIDSIHPANGQTSVLYGGGVTFDDEDIQMIFAFL